MASAAASGSATPSSAARATWRAVSGLPCPSTPFVSSLPAPCLVSWCGAGSDSGGTTELAGAVRSSSGNAARRSAPPSRVASSPVNTRLDTEPAGVASAVEPSPLALLRRGSHPSRCCAVAMGDWGAPKSSSSSRPRLPERLPRRCVLEGRRKEPSGPTVATSASNSMVTRRRDPPRDDPRVRPLVLRRLPDPGRALRDAEEPGRRSGEAIPPRGIAVTPGASPDMAVPRRLPPPVALSLCAVPVATLDCAAHRCSKRQPWCPRVVIPHRHTTHTQPTADEFGRPLRDCCCCCCSCRSRWPPCREKSRYVVGKLSGSRRC